MYYHIPRQIRIARSGLTLLELLVVLTILIALGGIVVASLPGLLERTQTATAAANVPEIDAAIKRNLLMNNGEIGNRFDSLLSGAGGINGEVYSAVGGAEFFEAMALSESDVAALAEIGITELIPAGESDADATFESHLSEPIPLAGDSRACAVSSTFSAELMQNLWNIPPNPNARYLVFGLGQRCSLVGGGPKAIFAEPPIHFSDNAASNPKNMYSRYLIVVELKTVDERNTTARYIGTAIPHRSGLRGVNSELKEFYSNQG